MDTSIIQNKTEPQMNRRASIYSRPLDKGLSIGNRQTRLPLIQGGMGVGVSLSRLAGAIAREGGIGVISTAQIGYRETDFYSDSKAANLRAMKAELAKARLLAGKDAPGLIGFNIMVATKDYPDYARTAAEAGADVIISGAGLPAGLPEYVQGYDVKIAPIVSSEKAARIILKLWDRRYKRTADFLVIENAHAGGHLGFSFQELSHIYEDGYEERYEEEIRKILACAEDFAAKYDTRIPVVLAGGIMNRKQAEHAFSLGVDGIQVATPFVTTEECDAADAFKEAYVKASASDIQIIKSPVGMPGRAIRNPFLEKVELEKEQITKCFRCLEKCDPVSAPYCITQALIRAVEGDVENGLIFCGDNVQYLDRISTVKEVIGKIL